MTRLSPGQWGSSCLNSTSDSNINGNMISNGNCGGTVLQQGQSGQAPTPTTVQNANPSIEVQRSNATAQPSLTSSRETVQHALTPLPRSDSGVRGHTSAPLNYSLWKKYNYNWTVVYAAGKYTRSRKRSNRSYRSSS